MIAPITVRACSASSNTGSSPPQTAGSHSLGTTSSGPIAIPVRKPSRSESCMQFSGLSSDIRNWSRTSRSTGPAGNRVSLIGRAFRQVRLSIAPGRVPVEAPIAASGLWGGAPVPRQQVRDLLGGMVGDPGEDVGQPGLWVDAVQLRGLDQGVDRRRPFATAVRAGEGPVAPTNGDAA